MGRMLKGIYSGGHGTVSRTWEVLSAGHAHEFPGIPDCVPGTFNVRITSQEYSPPRDDEFRGEARSLGREDGNHVAPCARVVRMNGIEVTCWIYRGGHGGENVLELLCRQNLADLLGVKSGDKIEMSIEEVELGTEGMPSRPAPASG